VRGSCAYVNNQNAPCPKNCELLRSWAVPKKKFAVDEGLAPQRAAKIPVTIRREMVEGDDGSTISVELAIQIAMLAERAYRRGVQQALAEAERSKLPSQTNVHNWRYDIKGDISPLVAEVWSLGNAVLADHVLPRAAMECSPLPELQRLLNAAIGKIEAKAPDTFGWRPRRRK